MIIGLLPLNDTVILMSGIKGAYEYHLNGPLKKIKSLIIQIYLVSTITNNTYLSAPLMKVFYAGTVQVIKVDTCDISDGLADNMIFSIYKDPENSLWIGSGTGLQRVLYDDANGRFKVRKFTNADGYEKCRNQYEYNYADGLGQVWIGTNQRSVQV